MNIITMEASRHQLVPDHTDAGQQYDHLCTELAIRLGEDLQGALQYHLLFERPSGQRWVTEDLVPVNGILMFPLPRALTQEYGSVKVQLRVYEETESGWKLKYTPVGIPPLYISKSITLPLDELPEDVSKGLLEDVTSSAHQAAKDAAACATSLGEMEAIVGDMDKALDEIIEIQESLIDGKAPQISSVTIQQYGDWNVLMIDGKAYSATMSIDTREDEGKYSANWAGEFGEEILVELPEEVYSLFNVSYEDEIHVLASYNALASADGWVSRANIIVPDDTKVVDIIIRHDQETSYDDYMPSFKLYIELRV